jgi:hypothetical protein
MQDNYHIKVGNAYFIPSFKFVSIQKRQQIQPVTFKNQKENNNKIIFKDMTELRLACQ